MHSGRALRERIDELIEAGATLHEIERDVIDRAPLREDARDALWLYAWGCLQRQRDVVAV